MAVFESSKLGRSIEDVIRGCPRGDKGDSKSAGKMGEEYRLSMSQSGMIEGDVDELKWDDRGGDVDLSAASDATAISWGESTWGLPLRASQTGVDQVDS